MHALHGFSETAQETAFISLPQTSFISIYRKGWPHGWWSWEQVTSLHNWDLKDHKDSKLGTVRFVGFPQLPQSYPGQEREELLSVAPLCLEETATFLSHWASAAHGIHHWVSAPLPLFMIWRISGGEFAGDGSELAVGIFVSYVGCSNIESEYPRKVSCLTHTQQSSHENCFCQNLKDVILWL